MAGAERPKAPRLHHFCQTKDPSSGQGSSVETEESLGTVSVGHTRLFVPPEWTKGAAAMERGSSADRFLREQKRKSKGLFKMLVILVVQ